MIEHMKRFVNEHHTLVVIIICVLVAWFLYWYFCCKGRPLANKIKGGEIGCGLTIKEDNYFQYVEMCCIPKYKELYLIALSKVGEEKVLKHVHIINEFDFFLNNFLKNNENIYSIIANPAGFLFGEEVQLFKTLKMSKDDIYNKQTNFDIVEILKDYGHGQDIIKLYYELMENVIKPLNGYFYKVKFVGQLAQNPLNIYISDMSFFETPNTYISKSLSGKFTSNSFTNAKEIYEFMGNNVRKWYIDNSIGKNDIIRCYENIPNGLIHYTKDYEEKSDKKSDEKNDVKFEVADVYPAYKLIMTVMLLLSFYPTFTGENATTKYDKTKYLKMIASYVLYVNLFNTFCGVRMEKSWNDTIKNEYVYIYKEGEDKNLNVPDIMRENIEILEGRMKSNHMFANNNVDKGEAEGNVENYMKKIKEHIKIDELTPDDINEWKLNEPSFDILQETDEDTLIDIKKKAREKYVKQKRIVYFYVSELCAALINLNDVKWRIKNLAQASPPRNEENDEPFSSNIEPFEENDEDVISLDSLDLYQNKEEILENPPINVKVNKILHTFLDNPSNESNKWELTLTNKIKYIPELICLITLIINQEEPEAGIDKGLLKTILDFITEFIISDERLISKITDSKSLELLLKCVDEIKEGKQSEEEKQLEEVKNIKLSEVDDYAQISQFGKSITELEQTTDIQQILELEDKIFSTKILKRKTYLDDSIKHILTQLINVLNNQKRFKWIFKHRKVILKYLESLDGIKKQYDFLSYFLFKTTTKYNIDELNGMELIILLQYQMCKNDKITDIQQELIYNEIVKLNNITEPLIPEKKTLMKMFYLNISIHSVLKSPTFNNISNYLSIKNFKDIVEKTKGLKGHFEEYIKTQINEVILILKVKLVPILKLPIINEITIFDNENDAKMVKTMIKNFIELIPEDILVSEFPDLKSLSIVLNFDDITTYSNYSFNRIPLFILTELLIYINTNPNVINIDEKLYNYIATSLIKCLVCKLNEYNLLVINKIHPAYNIIKAQWAKVSVKDNVSNTIKNEISGKITEIRKNLEGLSNQHFSNQVGNRRKPLRDGITKQVSDSVQMSEIRDNLFSKPLKRRKESNDKSCLDPKKRNVHDFGPRESPSNFGVFEPSLSELVFDKK